MHWTKHLRKFWVTILVLIAGSILCGTGKITAQDWMYIAITALGYYKLANQAGKK